MFMLSLAKGWHPYHMFPIGKPEINVCKLSHKWGNTLRLSIKTGQGNVTSNQVTKLFHSSNWKFFLMDENSIWQPSLNVILIHYQNVKTWVDLNTVITLSIVIEGYKNVGRLRVTNTNSLKDHVALWISEISPGENIFFLQVACLHSAVYTSLCACKQKVTRNSLSGVFEFL